MTTYRNTVFAGFAVALFAACGSPETFDRKQMLSDTVDEVILPTHETLDSRAADLKSSVETLCDGDPKTEQLETARDDWRSLQEPLKQIQAWSFNMSPYRGSSFEILFYKIDREPAYGDNIEAVIAGDGTYRSDLRQDGDDEPDKPFPGGADDDIDVEFIERQDYRRNADGYPAVEYLLFAADDAESTASQYRGGGREAQRRCDYLVAATKHADSVVDAYVDAWSPEGGNFAETFRTASSENRDWATIQDSINAMVSQMVFVTKQRISKNLLGGPLGQHEEEPTIPDTVSSPHANASLAQIEALFAGFEELYSGPDGKSLADYAKFRKEAVHEDVKTRIDEARSAIEDVPAPLEGAVEDDRETVKSAQSAVDSLTSVIEADLKTSLGASTTRVVVDND